MRKKLIAAFGAALLLTGCSAATSNADAARQACVTAAEEELGATIDASDIESTNFGDALYEAGVTDDRDTSDDDALFTVLGDFTFEKDGTQSRRSMLCMVDFNGGTAGEPDLTINGG